MTPIISSITPDKAVVGDPDFYLTIRGTHFTIDSAIVFGETTLPTVYVDDTYLFTPVPAGTFPKMSLGGVTVKVVDAHNGESNTMLFTVMEKSPVTVNDFVAMLSGIKIPASQDVVNTENEYVKEVPNIQVYRVIKGDTLQGIAARMVGDASRWEEIANINNLRYPYISDDPTILRGQTGFKTYLTRRVTPGTKVIYINGLSQLVTKGSVLFFNIESPLTNGQTQVLSDVAQVQQIEGDKNEAKVTLTAALYNTYEAGFKVDILTTSNNTRMKIVTQGDYILVPSNTDNASFVVNQQLGANDLYAILGEDLALDVYGHLWADTTGDLLSFSGLMNLRQAIQHRMITEKDELHYHPSYGNRLLAYIGSIANEDLLVFSQFEIRRTLLDDPRIREVTDVRSTIVGDTLQVEALAEVDVLNVSQKFNFVVKA